MVPVASFFLLVLLVPVQQAGGSPAAAGLGRFFLSSPQFGGSYIFGEKQYIKLVVTYSSGLFWIFKILDENLRVNLF